MVAQFQMALGQGRAEAHLTLDRSPDARQHPQRWLLPVTALLTLPFALALALAAVSSLTHTFRTHGVLYWLTSGHAGLLLACGPPLALLILVAARVRLHGSRAGGRWIGRVEARLERWEIVTALLAVAVAGVFFGHLAADAWACANGVRSAC